MDTRELPPDWRWAKIGEIAIVNKRNPRLRALPDDLPVTFLPMAGVDALSGTVANPETKTLGEVRKGFTAFEPGDVLFAKITPSMENGKAAIARSLVNDIGLGSTEFHVISAGPSVLPEWIFHFVRQESFRADAKANFSGTAGQLRVPSDFISSYAIPVPPLPEQRRIVELIETQFTRLDAAEAALKRVQANLRRYRAAVLKAACEGRLVPTEAELAQAEGRAYEPAAALLARILAERRAQWQAEHPGKQYKEPAGPDVSALPELPEGWCWATVEQVAENLDYRRRPVNRKERDQRTGNIPYYGANGQVGWIDTYIFDEPLVLVVEDETFTGREKSFSYKIQGKTWVNNHAHVLRAIAVNTDYLNNSLSYYPFTPLTTGTTGRRKLTQAALAGAPYALPPLSEQHRIVDEVERLLSVCAVHEQGVIDSLSRAQRLRQSILQRAFSGQLVEQRLPQSTNHEQLSLELS